MSTTPEPARDTSGALLTEDECWELLASQSVGRLATAVGGDPEIFPVSYAVADRRIFLRTKPGTKLVEVTISPRVAFEADDVGAEMARSVVVKGAAEVLERDADLAEAEATGLVSYSEDGKAVWIRVTPTQVSGRRLRRG